MPPCSPSSTSPAVQPPLPGEQSVLRGPEHSSNPEEALYSTFQTLVFVIHFLCGTHFSRPHEAARWLQTSQKQRAGQTTLATLALATWR
jgi:hypothetical protein